MFFGAREQQVPGSISLYYFVQGLCVFRLSLFSIYYVVRMCNVFSFYLLCNFISFPSCIQETSSLEAINICLFYSYQSLREEVNWFMLNDHSYLRKQLRISHIIINPIQFYILK